jgi:cellulose biosynthesis protein BcsQ
MVNSENRQQGSPEIDSDLAKDVANLYSWANVEDASYRDFSSQRKTRHIRHATDVDIRKSGEPRTPDDSIESQAQVFESSAAPPEQENSPAAVISPVQAPAETEPPQVEAFPDIFAPGSFLESGLTAPAESISPTLAIYSLAGGVGKTTFCANLGRIFSAMKEKVLLVDASGSGLLPFYFGATDLRYGLRTFVAPNANYPPLQVIGASESTKEWLQDDVKAAMRKAQRTIFDLGPASMGLLSEIFGMCGTVLVPLLPDLNSILSVSRIEASLKAMQCAGIQGPDVFYVFNRFDQQDSIDQRARALVERQCGERLLSITIRDSAEIAKAIASRMTVADHAPGSAVTHDYLELASWVRKRTPVRAASRTQARWSER